MSNQTGSTHPKQQQTLAIAQKWLRRALATVSVAFILLFLYTSLRRIGYPFSYDQVEGGIVTSVWRIVHGYPLYTRPTPDFVPYLYAPLYFYLGAAASKVMGVGYPALRLISILGTLGSFGVIYALVHSETRSRLASLAAAGLFAACYYPLEGWFDVVRVDSLFVFLFLLAIYCTRRAPILVAVLVWFLAFQTKQTILPVAFLVLCADWQRPRRMITGLLTLTAAIGASILLMNHLTGGWYSYYLFGTSSGLAWLMRTAALYIPSDLLQPLGIAFLILLGSLLCAPPAIRSRSTQFYIVVSFAIYASIWYLRSHAGSAVNTLMPAYAWTAVLFGIALHRLTDWIKSNAASAAPLAQVLLLSAATIQIVGLIYHPGRYIPSTATRQARQSFEQQLSALPGNIFIVEHSYDAILAGKRPFAVIGAFGLILDGKPSPVRTDFLADFHQAIDNGTYNGFIFDNTVDTYNDASGWLPADFAQRFPVRLLATAWSSAAGQANQPEERWIYLPCSVLDHDTSGFITPSTVVVYGNCPNAPSLKR